MQTADVFYDQAALVERLTAGVRKSSLPVIFLVGSPIAAPATVGDPGVPGVDGVVQIIREEFDDVDQRIEFDKAIAISQNRYQNAFSFLLGRRGQHAANEVIKRAVWKSRKRFSWQETEKPYLPTAQTTDEACRALDTDFDGWVLPPAAQALGRLLTSYPEQFTSTILTTNFDPLLEVSISKAGGHFFRTVLHRDGNIGQTEGSGCHVIHLHGYWYGADTLHTPRQLNQARPRLKASLSSLVKSKTLVISGYGGWDDIFTQTLLDIVLDDHAFPEIIWTFHSQPAADLVSRLSPGIDRGRVTLYSGVDCHNFFPLLLSKWEGLEPPSPTLGLTRPSSRLSLYISSREIAPPNLPTTQGSKVLEGGEGDRPPLIDICLGREKELERLLNGHQRAYFLTGIGGQGKSTIAARYFSIAQQKSLFDLYVWRDCKEESERFENQIINIIERLSGGSSTANALAQQSMSVLAELLVQVSADKKILFVFDNVDHYVDLEHNRLVGNADAFLSAFLQHPSHSCIVFTCRPSIHYGADSVSAFNIEGLASEAVIELFAKRGVKNASREEIEEAHALTGGHALWLDLIAAQVAKSTTNLRLKDILDELGKGSASIPFAPLKSIWGTLRERQRLVLRAMAEAKRPETDEKIAEYLRAHTNFNQVNRALRSLRDLNLIVVKPRQGSSDLLELHPLVRDFIRHTFPRQERIGFIDAIIEVYSRLLGIHRTEIKKKSSAALIQYWTENAELCVEAGKLNEALDSLNEIRIHIDAIDDPGAFVRACRFVFRAINWKEHGQYKAFDPVFNAYFENLVNLGRSTEYLPLIEQYATTVPTKDSRYVNYCNQMCLMHWFRLEFSEAIRWGQIGKELKDRSKVDTRWSTDHYLALAQRDSGIIDPALEYFLGGTPLEKVVDPEEFDDERSGPFYGNIGRCLHLMGQIDPAIICYRKSAIHLQSEGDQHVINQGFIRRWIGELLIAQNDFCTAKIFLEAAKQKWQPVCPPRIVIINNLLNSIERDTQNCRDMTFPNIERYCLAWIYGRENNFVPI